MTPVCVVHTSCRSRYRRRGLLAAVRQAANAACDQLGREAWELSVKLTDDETLRQLNRQYRGIDQPTDVLSFGGEHFRDGRRVAAAAAVHPPDERTYLGDIAISMDRCSDQARRAGHSPEAELALLVIHGTLHLLGYDHDTRRRKALMWAAQSQALKSLGFDITPGE